MMDMTWDEFEQHLIDVGWSPEDARAERLSNEHGDAGDPDGELEADLPPILL